MKTKLIVLISIFFCSSACFSQNVDLTKYLPKGYVKNGSIDYTVYIQKGLDQNKVVAFPNFPVLINENGLNARSNQILNFQKNSRLIMKPNSSERYGLLNLINVSNVTINDPDLVGDREKHRGTKGEWGMGINILSSSKITINNPQISKFWGDGIYIGEIPYKDRSKYRLGDYSSKQVAIKGGNIDNNRRNGISVISVKGLLIENILIQNTNGTMPMAGIDIEPNNNEQFLEDIVIRKVTTKNNAEVGIKYVSSNFIGKRSKNVSIIIENSQDISSKVGLYLGGARSGFYWGTEKLDGQITVNNFTSSSNESPLRTGSIQKYNPGINLKTFLIYTNGKRDYEKERKLKSEERSRKINVN